jgi:hypothetical protein
MDMITETELVVLKASAEYSIKLDKKTINEDIQTARKQRNTFPRSETGGCTGKSISAEIIKLSHLNYDRLKKQGS